MVNGDEHEVQVNDPDGREVIPKTKWNRGREYQISFVAKKVGAYHLTCSTHAATMAASIHVLPRKRGGSAYRMMRLSTAISLDSVATAPRAVTNHHRKVKEIWTRG